MHQTLGYVCVLTLPKTTFFCPCMARLVRNVVESSLCKNEFITQQPLRFEVILKFQISKLGIKM